MKAGNQPCNNHRWLPEWELPASLLCTLFSIGRSFTFLLLHSVTGCVFPLAHGRDSVLIALLLSHLLSLVCSLPEFVSVSARLSFSPGTDAGLDNTPSVTLRAEGTGRATLTCDDDVHGVAGG